MKVRVSLIEELAAKTCEQSDGSKGVYVCKNNEGVTVITSQGFDNVKYSFPKSDNGNPYLYNYQIGGFFRHALAVMGRVNDNPDMIEISKRIMKSLVFVTPRKITINPPIVIKRTRCMRCDVAQHEHVPKITTEFVPTGSGFDFEIIETPTRKPLKNFNTIVSEVLNFGKLVGLFHSCYTDAASNGKFTWEQIPEDKPGYVLIE